MSKPTTPPASTPSTIEALQAQLEALMAQNEALKSKVKATKTEKGVSFKVAEKGGVSVYGLSRFPVTLYESQWNKLFEVIPDLKAFIEANGSLLTKKGEKK